MADEAVALAAPPRAARLLIHGSEPALLAGGTVVRAVQWLLATASTVPRKPRSTLSRLRVADLEGHEFLACQDAPSVIELPLPAGTYHVTVRLGDARLSYTVTLEAGGCVELRPGCPGDHA